MPTNDIQRAINKSIKRLEKAIPGIERRLFAEVVSELRRLDTSAETVKLTVKNLNIINSIQNKIGRLVVSPEYKELIKEFSKTFNEITKLQTEYFQTIEKKYKPTPLIREIRNQAIETTVRSLGEQGIGTNVGGDITRLLRNNIGPGGSFKTLIEQFRSTISGSVSRYVSQVASDAITQYSAQVTRIVSADLGFSWYAYRNSLIITSRCFCRAMTENNYFHVTEISDLLKAKDLYCTIDNKEVKVKINPKTKLPEGMIAGTNESNFFIRRGGYNCRHQIAPVRETRVPLEDRARVYATSKYRAWLAAGNEQI